MKKYIVKVTLDVIVYADSEENAHEIIDDELESSNLEIETIMKGEPQEYE